LQLNSTLHQEVRESPSPGQRNATSTPLSPHLDHQDERNVTQRDNEGLIRQLGGRAQTNNGYRTRKGSTMVVSGGGVPDMMTGGRPVKKQQKEKEPQHRYKDEDTEAEEIPTRAQKRGKS